MKDKGIFDWMLDSLAYVAGVLLGCAVITKFCDIILRYFFNNPLTWDVELTEYILFAVAFLGTPWLLREGGHVRIDVFDNLLGEKKKTYLHLLHSVTGALVSIILGLISLVAAGYSYRDGLKVVKIYAVGKHYFLLIISLGFALMLAEFCRQFSGGLRKLKSTNSEKGVQ
jgi:TRAP-type C4-dicarboxylate transport system permease small subunit